MEVKLNGLYKVTVTEYECGVQRVDPNDTRFYTTLAVSYTHLTLPTKRIV